MPKSETAEHVRLAEATGRAEDDLFNANPWYEWGPYLSERAWGTVREDYSESGDAWDSFPHDHARSRAYRWNEDGMAGISDIRHELCLALALWNGSDPILKERMFGLTGPQGNHGEDVKEYWWYLEGLPSHALLKWRYHYPQAAFPYEQLVNHGRGLEDPELELLDTGVLDGDRYWSLSDRSRAGEALGADPINGQIRQVYFFATPDLALNQRGLVVRARRVQKRGDDSVVKLRPVVPNELPKDVRRSPNFGVEVDAMPGGTYVCSGSMKHAMGLMDVKDAVAGRQPLRKLFSKEQRALYDAHAPEGLALDDLSILGPILVLKLKFAPEGFARKLVAEIWLYPDNSMLLELSTKCLPSEAFQVMLETRAFLTAKGIDLTGEQETKTKKALQFFSKRLQTPTE